MTTPLRYRMMFLLIAFLFCSGGCAFHKGNKIAKGIWNGTWKAGYRVWVDTSKDPQGDSKISRSSAISILQRAQPLANQDNVMAGLATSMATMFIIYAALSPILLPIEFLGIIVLPPLAIVTTPFSFTGGFLEGSHDYFYPPKSPKYPNDIEERNTPNRIEPNEVSPIPDKEKKDR